MENKNLNIEVKDGVSTLIIREGEAAPFKPQKSIVMEGIINAPYQFVIGREINILDSHLKIYSDLGKLVLTIGDTDPNTTHVITGLLKKDSVLEAFGVNTDKRYSVQQFIKFVKIMRYFFEDKEAHSKLIQSLQSWSVKIERTIKEHNDNSGNSAFSLETKVGEIPGLLTKFSIRVPIFQGFEPRLIPIEIGLDPRATAVDLYLISDDLIEMEFTERANIMDRSVGAFEKYNFSKVKIS